MVLCIRQYPFNSERWLVLKIVWIFSLLSDIFLYSFLLTLLQEITKFIIYNVDRCELWGFIHEINSDISHVKYQGFFQLELLLHNYKCGGYVPCGVTVNTHTIVSWKNSVKCYWWFWNITNMTSLTSYEDIQFET